LQEMMLRAAMVQQMQHGGLPSGGAMPGSSTDIPKKAAPSLPPWHSDPRSTPQPRTPDELTQQKDQKKEKRQKEDRHAKKEKRHDKPEEPKVIDEGVDILPRLVTALENLGKARLAEVPAAPAQNDGGQARQVQKWPRWCWNCSKQTWYGKQWGCQNPNCQGPAKKAKWWNKDKDDTATSKDDKEPEEGEESPAHEDAAEQEEATAGNDNALPTGPEEAAAAAPAEAEEEAEAHTPEEEPKTDAAEE